VQVGDRDPAAAAGHPEVPVRTGGDAWAPDDPAGQVLDSLTRPGIDVDQPGRPTGDPPDEPKVSVRREGEVDAVAHARRPDELEGALQGVDARRAPARQGPQVAVRTGDDGVGRADVVLGGQQGNGVVVGVEPAEAIVVGGEPEHPGRIGHHSARRRVVEVHRIVVAGIGVDPTDARARGAGAGGRS